MNPTESNRNHPRKLEILAAVLRDDGFEPERMTDEQLSRYLEQNKVDMSQPQARFAALLKKAKARQRLEVARGKRLQAVLKARHIISAGAEALDATKDRVLGMIRRLGERDPEKALVYAREFEKTTPEDLRSLEEDLMLLDLEDPKDGEGH